MKLQPRNMWPVISKFYIPDEPMSSKAEAVQPGKTLSLTMDNTANMRHRFPLSLRIGEGAFSLSEGLQEGGPTKADPLNVSLSLDLFRNYEPIVNHTKYVKIGEERITVLYSDGSDTPAKTSISFSHMYVLDGHYVDNEKQYGATASGIAFLAEKYAYLHDFVTSSGEFSQEEQKLLLADLDKQYVSANERYLQYANRPGTPKDTAYDGVGGSKSALKELYDTLGKAFMDAFKGNKSFLTGFRGVFSAFNEKYSLKMDLTGTYSHLPLRAKQFEYFL